MRKIVSLMVAVLVLSMALPAFAAVDMNGKIKSELELTKNDQEEWEVNGKTGIDIKTELRAAGGNNVRGVIELDALRFNSFRDSKKDKLEDGSFGEYPSLEAPVISKAWLETEGAFWNGGPEVRTRVGDVKVNWNRLVGHTGDQQGVTVEGIEAGPVEMRGFYTVTGNDRPMGIQARADLMGLLLDGMVVYESDVGSEMAVQGAAEIVEGIGVDGYVALDAENNTLYRMNTTIDTVPGVTLLAGYRANNDFAAQYSDIGNKKPEDDAFDEHTGFNVGIETVQGGVTLAADYDDPTDTVTARAETTIEETDVWASTKLVEREMTETKFGAKRVFPIAGMNIHGEYEGKLKADKPTRHVLKANTKLNMISELEGLGVNAEVAVDGSELAHWKAGAKYSAPNGFDLGANYHSVDGPSITAGLKASF